jgi:hypothetical protein
LGPRFAGRLMWRNHVITPGPNIAWIKRDLHLCGLDLEKLSHLEANVHHLLELMLEVTRKTVHGNTNVYFDRLLGRDELAPDGAPDDGPLF